MSTYYNNPIAINVDFVHRLLLNSTKETLKVSNWYNYRKMLSLNTAHGRRKHFSTNHRHPHENNVCSSDTRYFPLLLWRRLFKITPKTISHWKFTITPGLECPLLQYCYWILERFRQYGIFVFNFITSKYKFVEQLLYKFI